MIFKIYTKLKKPRYISGFYMIKIHNQCLLKEFKYLIERPFHSIKNVEIFDTRELMKNTLFLQKELFIN